MTGRTWVVDRSSEGLRLDKFLADAGRLGSRARASDALARGKLFLNGAEASLGDASRRLRSGDQIRWWEDRPGSATRRAARAPRAGELPIVYEDDAIVVVNKAAGLLTVPLARRADAPSVQDALVEHFRSQGRRRPFVVHRIDRDTSGLVLFAKNPTAQARLKDQFIQREPERVYIAVVYGRPTPASGTWRDRLAWDDRDLVQKEAHPKDRKGQDAECRYKVVEAFEGASLIEVQLVTGRRNQIRLQARLHGHPLVGEGQYVSEATPGPIAFERQALHASRLGFRHPATGQALALKAPLPTDMEELIGNLRAGNLFRPRRSLTR